MPNKIIRDILGLRKTEGDVGVEIEMEARRPPLMASSGGGLNQMALFVVMPLSM